MVDGALTRPSAVRVDMGVSGLVSGSCVRPSHSWISHLLTSSLSLGISSLFCRGTLQLASSTSGQFHFRRVAFPQQFKNRVGLVLTKTEVLRITLNLDGTPIISKSHSPITLAIFSSINLVSIFRYFSSSSSQCIRGM
jgi:hypothetical protein